MNAKCSCWASDPREDVPPGSAALPTQLLTPAAPSRRGWERPSSFSQSGTGLHDEVEESWTRRCWAGFNLSRSSPTSDSFNIPPFYMWSHALRLHPYQRKLSMAPHSHQSKSPGGFRLCSSKKVNHTQLIAIKMMQREGNVDYIKPFLHRLTSKAVLILRCSCSSRFLLSILVSAGSEFTRNTKSWAELEASSMFSEVNRGPLLLPLEIGFAAAWQRLEKLIVLQAAWNWGERSLPSAINQRLQWYNF